MNNEDKKELDHKQDVRISVMENKIANVEDRLKYGDRDFQSVFEKIGSLSSRTQENEKDIQNLKNLKEKRDRTREYITNGVIMVILTSIIGYILAFFLK